MKNNIMRIEGKKERKKKTQRGKKGNQITATVKEKKEEKN
jgi:hypothetical protein